MKEVPQSTRRCLAAALEPRVPVLETDQILPPKAKFDQARKCSFLSQIESTKCVSIEEVYCFKCM